MYVHFKVYNKVKKERRKLDCVLSVGSKEAAVKEVIEYIFIYKGGDEEIKELEKLQPSNTMILFIV